jgi:putative redox protein
MKIAIKRINQAVLMEATNEDGAKLLMDGSSDVGGINGGLRPMQLLLAGIGGCSSIDVIEILKKQKQPLEDIKVDVEGGRDASEVPSLFKNIHLHFTLKGNLEKEKVERAINLSMEKYCSVGKTLERTATITHSYSIES